MLMDAYPFLGEELCEANYVQKFHHLLHIEELEMKRAFESFKIDCGRFTNKDDYLRLEVKDVAEKRPSIIIGDQVLISDFTGNLYAGYIHKLENDAILIKCHEGFHKIHNNKEYKIEFVFKRSTYKRLHHALDQMASRNCLGMDFIFPRIKQHIQDIQRNVQLTDDSDDGFLTYKGGSLVWFNQNLNCYQKEAVKNVLRGEMRPLPYIIYGPPGTGKTITLVECILQCYHLLSESRIIVATPSNSAADLLLEYLDKSKQLKKDEFIRFVGFNQAEKDLIPDFLVKFCATINIDEVKDFFLFLVYYPCILWQTFFLYNFSPLVTTHHIEFLQSTKKKSRAIEFVLGHYPRLAH
jgi:RNA helicase armi